MNETSSYDENNHYTTSQTKTLWRDHAHNQYSTETLQHWRAHPSERLSARRRSLASALNSSGHANFQHPLQRRLETLVNSIVNSLTKESVEFLTGPEGAVAQRIVSLLALATSRLVVTDEAKLAILVSVEEPTAGLTDPFHRKLQALEMKVPPLVKCVGVVVASAYCALLAVGLLLCLWWFTLVGLAQVPLCFPCRSMLPWCVVHNQTEFLFQLSMCTYVPYSTSSMSTSSTCT